MSHRLKRLGFIVERLAKSGHDIYESMIHFKKQDVIVIFQFVKMLPETQVILDYAKKLGITTVLFTDQLKANMNEVADIALYAHRGDTWEYHSMVAPTAVVETLIMQISMELEMKSLENLKKLSRLREEYGHIVPT